MRCLMIPKEFIKYKPEYFSHGKRSVIYLFKKGTKSYVIKTKKQGIGAEDPISNESKFLKLLNKYKIGPKYLTSGKNYVVYGFIKGEFFIDWIKTNKEKDVKKIIKNILLQCRIMDKLKINKKEFHKPIKHIIISKNNPVMIDFERCYYTENPKNVTQFCQFLLLINKIKPESIKVLKKYKENESEENFKKILDLI